MVLSKYQVEKLKFYFNFFDGDGNGTLERKDLGLIMERILDFTGWTENSIEALKAFEVHSTFFEILFERADEDHNEEIDLDEWLAMWEKLLPGTTGMAQFPVWLRTLPALLFQMIDRNNDEVVDEDELAQFYVSMCGVPQNQAKEEAANAICQMTDYGAYPLNEDSFEQVFANFLIGKTPYGPGRYIFGLFNHEDTKFQLIQPVQEDEVPNQTKGRRRKIPRAVAPRVKLQALK